MRYCYSSYSELAKKINTQNLKIIIYGAGMIGNIVVPYIISKYNLYENVLCYIDADYKKQGKNIDINGVEYPIKGIEYLTKSPENIVIFITNSNYMPVVETLDMISELEETEAYIIPILQVLSTHDRKEKYNCKKSDKQLIPKKIHYCWFSKNPIPEYLQKCIASWQKYCPDYEIIRWDEYNYDVEKNLYMKQAYEAKKWGFVPDIARLDILYNHGGIYLDTDVELLKNLDDLLYQQAFVGVEKWGNINMGGGSGAVAHHPVIKKMLEYRIHEKFIMEDGTYNQTTCGYYETKPLMELGMRPDNTIQNIEDMTIYSSDFFHPYDYMSGETYITDNTFSIHHFNGGWMDKSKIHERKQTLVNYKKCLVEWE